MAKIVSSYCTKVIDENRIFKDTIRVYRDALSLLIRIVESEWEPVLESSMRSPRSKHRGQLNCLFIQAGRVLPSILNSTNSSISTPVTCGGPRLQRRLAPYLRTVLLFLIGRVQAEKGKNLNSRPLVQLCRLSTKTTCMKTTVMGLPC